MPVSLECERGYERCLSLSGLVSHPFVSGSLLSRVVDITHFCTADCEKRKLVDWLRD